MPRGELGYEQIVTHSRPSGIDGWLHGPKMRLIRGREHVEALKQSEKEFSESRPFGIDLRFDSDSAAYESVFVVRKPVPDQFGTIFGDAIHNFRSSLDLMMWSIACQSNDVEKLWGTNAGLDVQFPICDTLAKFKRSKVLKLLPEEARTVLQELQPIPGSDTRNQLLGQLRDCSNFDKHRVPHVSVGFASFEAVAYRPGFHLSAFSLGEAPPDIDYELVFSPGTGLTHGQVIHRMTREDGQPIEPDLVHFKVRDEIQIAILYAAGGTALESRVLDIIGNSVERSLDEMATLIRDPIAPLDEEDEAKLLF